MLMNKLKNMRWFAALLFFAPLVAFAQDIQLNEIRTVQADSATRLILELSSRPPYRIFTLANPDRVVLDLEETHRNASLTNLKLADTHILKIRSGRQGEHTLRLVFDMDGPAHFNVLTGPEDQRLVIDITTPTVKVVQAQVKPKPIKKAKAGRTFVVVIDPGHGGKDPGTIGKLGTEEKNVVLSIGKKLAAIINQQPHMHAELTRDGDYFVRLRNRIKLAHKGKADLFVAIHADSYFKDNSTGASVYTLSARGATSEAARWLGKTR